MRFFRQSEPYSLRDWCISMSTPPEFPASRAINCDFGWNLGPISIEIGISRRRGRPSLRPHVRFFGESAPYRFRGWGISMSGPPQFPSSRAINCDFGLNSGPIAIEVGISRRRGRPSLRLHVRFFGESAPYSCRGWSISTSGPPEFPAYRSINSDFGGFRPL